jgi:hypothetical protein
MAKLNQSAASLRIFGDSLDPKEVSRILGCAPTASYLKGDEKTWKDNKSVAKKLVRKTGMWSLDATDQEPGNLNTQVAEIFGKLNSDLSVWASLTNNYKIDLFCGFTMEQSDEGIEISAKTLQTLGERNVPVGICLYSHAVVENELNGLCPCDSGKKYGQCCALKLITS